MTQDNDGDNDMSALGVCEWVSLRPTGKLPRGISTFTQIKAAAETYLHCNPDRPGASDLKHALNLANQTISAIESGFAEEAAWLGAQTVHAYWRAELADAKPMITGGVSAFRAAERENMDRSKKAKNEHLAWKNKAEELRKNPQHQSKSKANIAKLICPNRWNTIRRHI